MTAKMTIRERMAHEIVDFEARRDANGNLSVYKLPPGDGGGTFEVAGINDRYHPQEAAALAKLIKGGFYAQAELSAARIVASYTDVVDPWSDAYDIEFYLRDCCFNRGPKGAARILQRSLGVADDGIVGPKTMKAMYAQVAEDRPALLAKPRRAREQYERDVVGRNEHNIFWKGLVNRWNNALTVAQSFR